MATAQEKLDLIDARILEVLSSPDHGKVKIYIDGTSIEGDKTDILARLEKIRNVYALRVYRANNPGKLTPGITLTFTGRYNVV